MDLDPIQIGLDRRNNSQFVAYSKIYIPFSRNIRIYRTFVCRLAFFCDHLLGALLFLEKMSTTKQVLSSNIGG